MSTNTNNLSKILPGMVVVFKTHPYVVGNPFYSTSIILQNGDNSDSPIMVVTEIVKHFSDSFDENTGEVKVDSSQCDCKCIWYNPKSGKFEETWLSSKQLNVLTLGDEIGDSEIKPNSTVSLKSLPIEKAKLNRVYEKNLKHITLDIYRDRGLHIYEPPLMQVIEVKSNSLPENPYDSRSGNQKKFNSAKKAKCKWFNTILNKFSDEWIPMNVLLERKIVDPHILQSIEEAIKNKKFLRSSKRLLTPSNIVSDGFTCRVSGFDIISNRQITVDVLEEKFDFLSTYIIEYKTGFTELNKSTEKIKETLTTITDTIDTAKDSEKAIRILYTNLKGETLSRVITKYDLQGELLIGHCNLRNDKRHFYLQRIKSLEIIDFPSKQD